MIDLSTKSLQRPETLSRPAPEGPSGTPVSQRDRELIAMIRRSSGAARDELLDRLFRRHHQRVLRWCRRYCGDPETAADLTQEVFLRVHQRLDTFRQQSSFTTWLYTVTRSVAINRNRAERSRRAAASVDDIDFPEPVDPAPDAADVAAGRQMARELRRALESDLEPREAQVLYLHFVDAMTLPAITELLGLENKSGAKAYIVSGKRKLHRRFGPWLRRQSAPRPAPARTLTPGLSSSAA